MAATCPYCGEAVMESGLSGHVILADDDAHGLFGEFPADFDPPEPTGNASDERRDAENDDGDGPESEGDRRDRSGEVGGLLTRVRSRLGRARS